MRLIILVERVLDALFENFFWILWPPWPFWTGFCCSIENAGQQWDWGILKRAFALIK